MLTRRPAAGDPSSWSPFGRRQTAPFPPSIEHPVPTWGPPSTCCCTIMTNLFCYPGVLPFGGGWRANTEVTFEISGPVGARRAGRGCSIHCFALSINGN